MDISESAPNNYGFAKTDTASADYTVTIPGSQTAPELMRFASVEAMVKKLQPAQSVHCLHPEKLREAARLFIENFPGHSLYAIKANPDPYVLHTLHDAGITHFDVASLGEVIQVREMFPDAHLAFMNPVKSREAIRHAYFNYAVRDFVVDTRDEIDKIVDETQGAHDLLIVVRVAMPKGSAAYALTDKFGCTPDQAIELLRIAHKVASRVGLSFHVGSQTVDPISYTNAIRLCDNILLRAGVKLDVFDIGGGFPIPDLGMDIPPLVAFFKVIREEIAKLHLPESCEIWSEPGRALSGTCSTFVARVELRKGNVLYLNDGTFGNMFEVASGKWKNTAHLIRRARKTRKIAVKPNAEFSFYGPTCDSVDYMPGPFMLPDDIGEGDFIALDGMGAYMAASRTHFNGFFSDMQVEIVADTAAVAGRMKSTTRLAARRAHLKIVR